MNINFTIALKFYIIILFILFIYSFYNISNKKYHQFYTVLPNFLPEHRPSQRGNTVRSERIVVISDLHDLLVVEICRLHGVHVADLLQVSIEGLMFWAGRQPKNL